MDETFVSVVAPIHDPGAALAPFVQRVAEVLASASRYYEIILVDDGSRELDRQAVADLLVRHGNVRMLRLSRAVGEEQAILAGLDVAIGDYVITMAANADPPELIPQFLSAARGGADVVLGVRTSRVRDPWWLRAGAHLFYGYVKRFLALDVPRNATHFRCLSRQAVHALGQLRKSGMRLRVFTTYLGFAPHLISYEQVGSTSLSRSRTPLDAIGTAFAIMMDGSRHPLRLASALGVLAALLNLAYAAYVIIVYTMRREVAPGWATLSLTSAAQFFFLALMIAVLCEYVGRLSAGMQDMPAYYVMDEHTSPVMLERDRRNVVGDSSDPSHG